MICAKCRLKKEELTIVNAYSDRKMKLCRIAVCEDCIEKNKGLITTSKEEL